jgi:hypothetical protein
MGKPLELDYEVPRDGRLVHHPEFYYGMSRVVHSHIDARAGGSSLSMKIYPAHTLIEKLVSSQGRDDEQFRLEPTRSTAFKVWLSLDCEGKSSFYHLPLLCRILFEWNNTWIRYKRRLSPLPTIMMDLEERLLLRHRSLAYRILFE